MPVRRSPLPGRHNNALPAQVATDTWKMTSGPRCGTRTTLVRFAPCPPTCGDCQSPESFVRLHPGIELAPPEDLAAKATADTLLTGADPMMWQHTNAFTELLHLLGDQSSRVHVETGCTYVPSPRFLDSPLVSHFTVCPLIGPEAAMADHLCRRLKEKAVAMYREMSKSGAAHFYFPAGKVLDVDDAAAFAQAHGIPADVVWIEIDPDGEMANYRKKELRAAIKREGFHRTS